MTSIRPVMCAALLCLIALPIGIARADNTPGQTLAPQGSSAMARAAASKVGLAAVHQTKAGAECKTCHGDKIAPDDNETVENKACVSCHGNYEKLASETVKKLKNKNINPHKSHLGPEITCTVCHAGHSESAAYCTQCHTNFVMPMPGNAKN